MATILGQRTFAPSWEQNSTWADARIPFRQSTRLCSTISMENFKVSSSTSWTWLGQLLRSCSTTPLVFEKKIHKIFVNQDEQRVLPTIVWTSIAVRLVKHDPWSSQASDVTVHDVILHSFHSGKTVAMLISPSRSRIPTIDFRINLDGAEMKFVKQTRLLGIIIDDSLSWSYHIESVCCKVGRKIGALRRSFRLLTPHARRTFYM